MKGSLIIVGFFILGIISGLSGVVPGSIVEGNLTFYALCALLLFVGIGIGSDREILKKFKSLDLRMALLPLGGHFRRFSSGSVGSFRQVRTGLSCSGFGLRLLFFVKYFHYGVQGCGAWYHCIAGQYYTRDDNFAFVAVPREGFRSVVADSGRRRDFDGHHTADHHVSFR